MVKSSEHIKSIVGSLPNDPGIYQFFNSASELIYVGKAKNIKKRVSSYFNKDKYENGKTATLVRLIRDIKYLVVETEMDALLLENNLIKKHQPRYNVMLKDDKTYPWICIKNERFPRIFSTRKNIDDGSLYFGPYASVRMINALLEFIKGTYKIRTCTYNLSKEKIDKKKFKVCLEYHIGNCKGPCEGLQTDVEYNANIEEIKQILKGNISSVIKDLSARMETYSGDYNYEMAQFAKIKIDTLERFKSKSVIVNSDISDVDVFSIVGNEYASYVNYFKVINGSIVQGHTLELRKKLDESDSELLNLSIAELRSRYGSSSPEIIVPFNLDLDIPSVKFTQPKIGDKKHLLMLSKKNAMQYMRDRQLQMDKVDPARRSDRVLSQMQKDLNLSELPTHIECFDNSNLQGTTPVAAVSVFINAKAAKKEYRHFNIKTVEGANDFASMEEIVFRRYKRLTEENKSLPQLIIIDGGKGQLSAAIKSLDKLDLRRKIAIIGIAKKLEEIYYPNDPVPLYLDKKGETLKIIQQLRDEVHRFAITHHRNKRSKNALQTDLTKINGIGESIASKLLNKFRSVKKVKEASLKELEGTIGKSKANTVFTYYHPDK